jgi:hypothetical protein
VRSRNARFFFFFFFFFCLLFLFLSCFFPLIVVQGFATSKILECDDGIFDTTGDARVSDSCFDCRDECERVGWTTLCCQRRSLWRCACQKFLLFVLLVPQINLQERCEAQSLSNCDCNDFESWRTCRKKTIKFGLLC